MNPDYIQNSIITRDLNPFVFRPLSTNFECYTDLKVLGYHKRYDKVFNPFNLNVPIYENKIYHYGLPFTHGNFNTIGVDNTYNTSGKNYIAPAYRIAELYPSQGIMSNVMKIRETII